ncbi:MAG: cation diffusion facilitator family transporter [Candidatus Caenarcaniphilales bacterium]|nr:cation diffusion facilitator family transporter [Candidatus Caenarcaniphilales bacterium]
MHQSAPSKVALKSVLAAGFLTTLKIVVGFQSGSLGILAEAAHSALDLIAAFITLWAVKLSAKPADQEHHFGHGKFESISALIETILLWITCSWIVYEAVMRLTGTAKAEIEPSIWAFGVLGISIVVDFFRSRDLDHHAKLYDSPALAADALHFKTDILASLAVMIGLIGVIFGFEWADGAAALAVAGWTFFHSLHIAREAFDQLTDRAPSGMEEKIQAILSRIPSISAIKSLRIRKAGANSFIDLTVCLPKDLTFEHAHQITEEIEAAIRINYPRAEISVHAEPV